MFSTVTMPPWADEAKSLQAICTLCRWANSNAYYTPASLLMLIVISFAHTQFQMLKGGCAELHTLTVVGCNTGATR
jgi:hypothetical protein